MLTFTLGTGIASLVLYLINFPKGKEPSQVAQSAIHGLAIAGAITALIFGLLTIVCLLAYPLTRHKVMTMQEHLDSARRLGQG